MKTNHVAVILCTVGVLCSCNPLKQRVDTAWLRESLSAPQDDAVVVESGQGLAPSAAPAPTATKRSWFSQRQSEPAVQGTQPTVNTGGSWWSRRQQQLAPKPVAATPAVAEPTAPVEAVTTAASRTYTVQKGDTLSSIAAKYGVNTSTLIALNGLSANPDALQVGQVLSLPAVGSVTPTAAPQAASAAATAPTVARATGASTYTVVAGDTLSRIAARNGTTVAKIIAANGFTEQQAHNLKIGQTIKLPKK